MEYTTYSYINMAVDAMGCLVILPLTGSLLINQRVAHRKSRVLFLLLATVFLSLLNEFLSWAVLDFMSPFWRGIYSAVNFLAYFIEACVLGLYMLYIYLYIESKSRAAFYLACLCFAAIGVYMFIILATPFNEMLYSINPQNGYQWGTYYVLGPICSFTAQALAVSVIFFERGTLGRKRAAILSSYLIFPVITVPIHLINPNLPISFAVMPLAMIMIYVDFQIQERSDLLINIEKEKTAIMISQIQPHFLFNSLTCIRQLCDTDAKKASDALEHFSHFLRGNVDSLSNKGLIPFEQEMIHVQDYLYLEKMRFGEKLDIRMETAENHFLLPPLTLQPIVENAVRYGVMRKKGGGVVTIKSERLQNTIVVTVADNGIGFDPEQPAEESRTHMGIENIKARLGAQCGGSLYIKSVKGGGTEVKMVLPQERR